MLKNVESLCFYGILFEVNEIIDLIMVNDDDESF